MRLRSEPDGTIRRIADLLGVDCERVRLWTFARAAAEPRDDWRNDHSIAVARAIAHTVALVISHSPQRRYLAEVPLGYIKKTGDFGRGDEL